MSSDQSDPPDPSLQHELLARLRLASESPVLLVACDCDDLLAPAESSSSPSSVNAEVLAALADLASVPNTHVALISGLSRMQLRERLGGQLSAEIRIIGAHGQDPDHECSGMSAEQREAFRKVNAGLTRIAADHPGVSIEKRQVSLVMHYHEAHPTHAEHALRAADRLAGDHPCIEVIPASGAVELIVVPSDHMRALNALRRRCGANVVVLIGDDRALERASGSLGPDDISLPMALSNGRPAITPGSGSLVAERLRGLNLSRRRWLLTRDLTPIENLSILSDQRTIAVLDPCGRLCWLCMPRIDSPALFASLLHDSRAGVFEIFPAHRTGDPTQEYVQDTLLLRTKWPTMTVTDYLDCSRGRPTRRQSTSELLRVVEGSGEVLLRFSPRLDFGRAATRLVAKPGALIVEGGHEPVVLLSPGITWVIEQEDDHETARATVKLGAQPLVLELRYGHPVSGEAMLNEPARREATRRFWADWADSLSRPGLHDELILRSALTLRALCHGPTGAICAAATTSLPEHLGGVRNWDYRFCWPRDSSLAAASLLRLGDTSVAIGFVDWLAAVVRSSEHPESLHPLYTVDGADAPTESEIGELAGYGGSRPVRVGNLATHQVQLDVFGPIVNVVAMLAERGVAVSPDHWRLVEAMVRAVEIRWSEPDHGIWEIREPTRHHVHSKVMCWHAVDRALTVAKLGVGIERPEWKQLREQIRTEVLTEAWNQDAGAFSGTYEEFNLDAAVLFIGLANLIPADDPRWISTVLAVERGLCDRGFVRRYRDDDGLPGHEGAWIVCTSWLIEALVTIGRRDDARVMFDRMAEAAGPLGLMSEEYDPATGTGLGNFPQAYSHLGLINAAVRIMSR